MSWFSPVPRSLLGAHVALISRGPGRGYCPQVTLGDDVLRELGLSNGAICELLWGADVHAGKVRVQAAMKEGTSGVVGRRVGGGAGGRALVWKFGVPPAEAIKTMSGESIRFVPQQSKRVPCRSQIVDGGVEILLPDEWWERVPGRMPAPSSTAGAKSPRKLCATCHQVPAEPDQALCAACERSKLRRLHGERAA